MKDGPNIARIAALIGDHARAEVLTALMADRALTATELAQIAGVSKPTMSAHLAKLLDAGLISGVAQGRHRYFRLADADVARLLEALMGVAFRAGAVRVRSSPREPALRKARVCYDHLAGELGVKAYETLLQRGCIEESGEQLRLTEVGKSWFAALQIDVHTAGRRQLCRPCLDWSERRHHLGGALGAQLLRRLLELGWAKRDPASRVVAFSARGERELERLLQD